MKSWVAFTIVYKVASKKTTNECSLPFYKLNVPLKRGGRAPLYYLNWTQVKLANNDIKLTDIIDWTESIANDPIPRTRAYAINTLELISIFKSQESDGTIL